MKKCLSILLCIALVFSLALCVSAVGRENVIDEAELLDWDEQDLLEKKADELWDSCRLDVAILTVDSTYGESVQTYADDYYDENDFGYGSDHSGILLLLCMDTREWYITTCGEAIYIFTDYGLEQMGNQMLPYLAQGSYYDAFDTWLDSIPEYYEAFLDGTPIDGYVAPDAYEPIGGDEIVHYQPDTKPNYFVRFLIALAIGAVVAGIAVLIMRSTMNTAKRQANAVDYIKAGSYQVNVHRDMFLYRQVTKTPKPDNSSSGSRGGGSSVHRSSGGASHGGRGGRF